VLLLDSTHRPKALGEWMKKHRDYDTMPDLSMQIDDFSTDWWQWWEILRPEWRGDGLDFSCNIPEGASWAEICKGGPMLHPGIRTEIIIYFRAPNRSCESFSYVYRPSLCLRNITMPTYSHVHMFTYSRSFISDSGN
jgi:hypothetical protein